MNIYHYSNEPLYQHSNYQQCSLLVDQPRDITLAHDQFEPVVQNVINLQPSDTICEKSKQAQNVIHKTEKNVAREAKVDTSNFSIEERLLAAVWVHERKRTRSSISQIRREFQQRFGREPPAKNTLLVWERKLFSTGSVYDAPRPGRPVNRKSHVDQVAASVRSSPALSLRARAVALRLPRTTLRNILHKDLPQMLCRNKDVPNKNLGKQSAKRGAVKQIRKVPQLQYGASAAPGYTPPTTSGGHIHDYV